MEKKTHYSRTTFGIAIIVILGAFFALLPWKQKNKTPDIDITGKFEAENFTRAVDLKNSAFAKCNSKMLGAVVPHHMVGGKFIADVFSQAKDVDTVVVIGPNHYEKGSSAIITTDSDWITAKGKIQGDKVIASELVSQKIALVQSDVIGADHSIGNILPFIAYYLPGANVVPIILKRDVPKKQFEDLLLYIASLAKNKRILIVGSADFSHYLTEQESEKKDAQTIEAIEHKDYRLIETFHNDNLDSPPTVNAVLGIMEKMGDTQLLWQNSNSFKVLGGDINSTTSYFELVFCKK